MDVTALLSAQGTNIRITAGNAVPEFRQVLDRSGSVMEDVHTAFEQLGKIIRDFIRHSTGDSGYGRSLEALRVMREEAVDLELPSAYNEFIKKLKTEIITEELSGERRDMWFLIRSSRLGLIQSKEVGASGVGEEEAKEFLTAKLK